MSADANQEQIQAEVPAAAPESQPVQGGDTPAVTQDQDSGSAQQAQGAQQQPPMIPKWRFDEVNQKARAYEEQLRALQQGQPQAPQQKPADQAPKADEFSTYEDFIEAKARFAARQEYQQAKQAEQQQSQQQGFQERVRKADESFTEKVYEAAVKDPTLIQKLQNAPTLRPDLHLFGLKEADSPVELAKYLADNPGLVVQLNQMPPERGLREMGKIEAKLQGSSGQPVRKPSAGIPVLDAVGGGQKPGTKSPDQYSQDDVIGKLYPTS